MWVFSAVGTAVFALPALVVLLLQRPHLGGAQFLFIVGPGSKLSATRRFGLTTLGEEWG